MLTVGHLSASYLISQVPIKGEKPSLKDVLLVIFFGYFLDLDLLITPLFGLPMSFHHYLPFHTPLFVIVFCFLTYFFLKKYFSEKIIFLAFFAAFFHLVLDDLGYWLQLLGLQEESKIPQIFWLYPFDPRRSSWLEQAYNGPINFDLLKFYLVKAPLNVLLEIMFFVGAIVTYTVQRMKSKTS